MRYKSVRQANKGDHAFVTKVVGKQRGADPRGGWCFQNRVWAAALERAEKSWRVRTPRKTPVLMTGDRPAGVAG